MKRHLQCAEQQVSRSNLTKYCACHAKLNCKISDKIFENRWNVISNAGPIRPWSEHDPSMIRPWSDHENANRNPPRKWGYFSSSPGTFSIVKYNVSSPILHSNIHQVLRLPQKLTLDLHRILPLPRKVTLELHQVLHLPRKVTLELHQVLRLSRRKTHILSPHRIWNVIYSARSNRCHHPTSPNTAPATKNDSTALSSSHMKRHFQCAEQQVSLSNLTKYCACHEKWHCKISKKISKNRWNVISNAGPIRPWSENDPRMIRAWSDHDPTMKTQTATRLASEVTFRAHHEHFLLKNTTFRAQSYIQTFTKYCACHEKWHLNVTKYCACHEKWHLNFTKYCACHEKWHLNFTKYCTCHEKWLDCCIVLTYETSFPMRGATGVTIQPPQILHLPRKMTLQDVKENLQKQVKRHFQCGADPTMIRAWSEHDPRMLREWSEDENANRNPPRKWGYFSRSPGAFSIVKYNVSSPILHSNIHQVLRLPRKVTLDLHRILPLPRKVTLELHQILPLPRKVTLDLHQVLHLPRKVTFELHQVLHLPRKVTRIVHPRDIWNLIYNARSKQCLPPNSPNTAPATQNDHLTCGRNLRKTGETSLQCGEDPRMIRAWSEHDPTMIRPWSDHENANRNPPRKWGYFSSSPGAVSIVKYNVSSPILHSNIHQVLRLPQKVTLDLHRILHLPRKVTLDLHRILPLSRKVTLEQILPVPRKVTLDLHQVLHLPRKVTRIVHPRDIWNLIYNARSNQCLPPNSPNTAPATQNDHLTCGRNLRKTGETSFPMRGRSENDPSMIRAWSDHDPTMKTQTATRLASEVTFRAPQEHFLL